MRAIDLTGTQFGKLTAIRATSEGSIRKWICRCTCGTEAAYSTGQLNSGKRQSCGCSRFMNLEGQVFGSLLVLHEDVNAKTHRTKFLCQCVCGGNRLVEGTKLKNGRVQKCLLCAKSVDRSSKYRLPDGQALINRAFASYQHNARTKGLAFNLPKEIALELFARDCFYCGSPPSNTLTHPKHRGSFTYNGIDRLDNSKGYEPENCVTSCQICNFMKNSWHVDAFLTIVHRIANTCSHVIDNTDMPKSTPLTRRKSSWPQPT